ncbi:hypothetical protein FE257_012345 [Aspergillus nanangensis]|uniref:Uncharacterized protein n=1 Tax=Aspergillus nanangensis TaxID=2582783 RepID=A0AAD4GRV1_ASPNN|nr:hypothetical protein FE257_012345 [Aspergillus nanangensis]
MMLGLMFLLITTLFSPAVAAGSVLQEPSNLLGFLTRRASGLVTDPPLDESLLAIQIGGIVGAYVIFVAILLSLLLFVGRRLRRTVHASNFSLQVEMMKPSKPSGSMDPSPVTPISANLPSPGRMHGSWSTLARGPKSHISGNGSVATIDESVVAHDRRRAQEEMEMLYARVLEYDEQKAAGREGSHHENDMQSPDSAQSNPFTDRSRISDQPSVTQMKSPKSPRSSSRLSRISSLSLFNNSNSRPEPNTSKLRSPRFPLRKLSISSPLASPDVHASTSYGDQAPLTPRLYNPPPPPPAPPATSSQASLGRPPGSRAPAPPPLSLSPATHSKSSLPFRDAYPSLQSAPATKTTVLERPEKPMNGPRTGLPTPYSPYMPFTPVTPLTPSRIVTKKQRKREAKENGLRVLNEEDVVRDEGDMWGY